MKIALGQLDMVWENKEASLAKVEQMLQTAVAAKADLILFPEMSLTGFSMHLDRIGERPDASESVQRMSELAAHYEIAVGFGWSALPEGQAQKGTNRFTLIDETGSVLAEYSKLHPFRYGGETEAYQGGEQLVAVPYKGHILGLFVCYDLRFPEIFQIVSGQADILLVIANWPSSRRDQWITLLRARAIENQAYVAGVNCVGVRDHLEYSGDSAVFDPLGNMLGTLCGQEGVLICELENLPHELRDKFQAKCDRREEFYIAAYTNREGK